MYWKPILTLLLLTLTNAVAFSQDPLGSKMTCHEVKFLPREKALTHPKVELEGIVTCIPAGWKGFFISDASGGVYCEPFDLDSESTFWPVHVGEKIVLQGVISEGHLNSFVLVIRVTSREASQLPSPSPLTLSEVAREVHDANFVSVRGIMVRITNIAGEMEYGLVANGKECHVVHASFRVDPKLPVHTEVEISGVVIPTEGEDTFKIVRPEIGVFSCSTIPRTTLFRHANGFDRVDHQKRPKWSIRALSCTSISSFQFESVAYPKWIRFRMDRQA